MGLGEAQQFVLYSHAQRLKTFLTQRGRNIKCNSVHFWTKGAGIEVLERIELLVQFTYPAAPANRNRTVILGELGIIRAEIPEENRIM